MGTRSFVSLCWLFVWTLGLKPLIEMSRAASSYQPSLDNMILSWAVRVPFSGTGRHRRDQRVKDLKMSWLIITPRQAEEHFTSDAGGGVAPPGISRLKSARHGNLSLRNPMELRLCLGGLPSNRKGRFRLALEAFTCCSQPSRGSPPPSILSLTTSLSPSQQREGGKIG